MLRWPADDVLNLLIRRYYGGEAGLWGEIRMRVDAELRRRGVSSGSHHLRLHRLGDQGYEVVVEGAAGFEPTEA